MFRLKNVAVKEAEYFLPFSTGRVLKQAKKSAAERTAAK